jgi:hypothetical protein
MEQSDDEWFDAVINVMKISDIFDGIVEAEESLKNASRKRIYESHHRTKDLWSTPWGAMLLNMEVSTELSFERRKFRDYNLIYNAMKVSTIVMANSRLVLFSVSAGVCIWSLKVTRKIKIGDEILFNYSRNYVFPEHYGAGLL